MSDEHQKLQLIQALSHLQYSSVGNDFAGAPIAQDSVELVQYFSFGVGHINFVIRSDSFCAVFVETLIASVPNAPSLLLGLSNIRGTLIPVYQLHRVIGAIKPKKNIILCIGKGEQAVGLLIDALPASLMLTVSSQFDNVLSDEKDLIKKISSSFYLAEQKKWYLIEGEEIAGKLLQLASIEQRDTASAGSKAVINQTAYL